MFLKKVNKNGRTYFLLCQFDKDNNLKSIFITEEIFNLINSLGKYKLVER